jgi:hypothetical protein
MKYQQKSFTVPAAGPNVTQEEWDRIFGKKKAKTEDGVDKSEETEDNSSEEPQE